MVAAAELAAATEPTADDELWEEWAEAEESADEQAPSDVEQTVEMAAVRSADGDPTPLTDEAWLVEDDSAAVDEAPGPEPVPVLTAPSPSYRYTPPSDLSQSDAHVVFNVVSTWSGGTVRCSGSCLWWW